jgi:diguanylate cyclase (GGDEF)-like protein
MLACAVVAFYAVITWVCTEFGLIADTEIAGLVVAGTGVAGLLLIALAAASDFKLDLDRGTVLFGMAMWMVVAGVLYATIAIVPLRLMMLTVTLLAIAFAGLHLRRPQLGWLAVSAWIVYSLALAWRLNDGEIARPEFEQVTWLGFSAGLVLAVVVAGEIAGLRAVLTARTQELEVTLERLHELAMRDDLTGLYNRRQLMDYLQRQKALADRGSLGFAICYVDLDYFKRVNDRFGHTQGDEVLKAFADIAAKAVREEDFVARLGGEEFILVLTNASVKDARRVADRLRRQTQLMVIDPKEPDFSVTASVGIAAYQPREAIQQLLNRADGAMYTAKTRGRNRVVVAGETEISSIDGALGR